MKQQLTLLTVIRAALKSHNSIEYEASLDTRSFLKLVKSQNLIPIVYPVLEQQTDDRWKQLATFLKEEYYKIIHKAFFQQKDIDAFLQEMELRGEACLPLKGWIMREYYPDRFLRNMNDFDVLMRDFKREKYQDMMESLGYHLYEIEEGQHDVYYKKPYTVIELHTSLSSFYMKNSVPVIDRWLRQIWERCILQDGKGCIYRLTSEDFYLYHLFHMYKHIKEGGCGIRPMIDIFVFLEKEEAFLDWEYIFQSLKDMKLTVYERTMRTTAKAWFSSENPELSEEQQILLSFMLSAGLYGSKENQVAGRIVSEKGEFGLKKKIAMIFKIVFLPFNEMTLRFRVLKKLPFLLPVCWMIRVFKMVFEGKIGLFLRSSTGEFCQEMEEIYRIAGIE